MLEFALFKLNCQFARALAMKEIIGYKLCQPLNKLHFKSDKYSWYRVCSVFKIFKIVMFVCFYPAWLGSACLALVKECERPALVHRCSPGACELTTEMPRNTFPHTSGSDVVPTTTLQRNQPNKHPNKYSLYNK